MASLNQITEMCKNGQVQKAYELAKVDMEQQLPWSYREMGWVLYYLIKNDVETDDYSSLLSHLHELKSLDRLTVLEDSMLFENVLFKVAGFVKAFLPPTNIDTPPRLSALFDILRNYNFDSSKGYSFLLQSFIKCDSWQEMTDFLDWWNLDKLRVADYAPFQMNNGRTIMSVAERAFIAKSKALLRLNDLSRIEMFLPEMEDFMKKHPEMLYPGYFYGKLLLAFGSTQEETLKVIVPFVRKKATEFWVWQLLGDVFVNDSNKQLACLLRAVHCKTQEKFLIKIRIKLATFFIQRQQLDLVRYQIDKVVQCCLLNGWHLPYEIDCWIHQPWIEGPRNGKAPIDYMSITDEILCDGTEEAIAVVTYIDKASHKTTLIFGREKRMSQKLRFPVGAGDILKINCVTDVNGSLRVLSARKTQFQQNLDYVKIVEGTVKKLGNNDFAFLKTKEGDFYISPNVVNKYELRDGETVKSLVVYDYNRKKAVWNWICINIIGKNN